MCCVLECHIQLVATKQTLTLRRIDVTSKSEITEAKPIVQLQTDADVKASSKSDNEISFENTLHW